MVTTTANDRSADRISSFTKAQTVGIKNSGFTGLEHAVNLADQPDVEDYLKLLSEISAAKSRADLPILDIIKVSNEQPEVLVLTPSNIPLKQCAPTVGNGVKVIPIVVSEALFSSELALTQKERCAVILDAVQKFYDKFNAEPLTQKGAAIGSAAVFGIVGGGGSLMSDFIKDNSANMSRRAFGCAASGALVGAGLGYFEQKMIANSGVTYLDPIVEVDEGALALAKTKINDWKRKRGHVVAPS